MANKLKFNKKIQTIIISSLVATSFLTVLVDFAVFETKGEFTNPFYNSIILVIGIATIGLLVIILGAKIYMKIA